MMHHRANSLAAQRFADRRQREDDAPKLGHEVPSLTNLALDIEERTGVGGTRHLRRIMVDRAPALFLVPCGDPRCVDGEHDLTMTVMRALRAHETSFTGTDECRGSLGPAYCTRVLHFAGKAEYSAS